MHESHDFTFVFADLAGYTALTDVHGDEEAASAVGNFYAMVRKTLSPTSHLVKTLGDGVLIAADCPEEGVRVALAMAELVAAQTNFPDVHVGIHAGPAVVRDGDYFGVSVNLAARLMQAAKPGQILCTEAIASVAAAAGLAHPIQLGLTRFKNVSHPVGIYELDRESDDARLEYLDPVCRMRLDAMAATVSVEHDGMRVHFCSHACATRFIADPAAYLLPYEG